MNIRKLLWVAAACLLFLVPSRAQDRVTVSGLIVDEAGQPVPGAAVTVKGNPSLGGAVSDTGGQYTVTVPAGSVLEVSCIGFASQEKRFAQGGIWNISLEPDSEVLEDVVVVGYGTQKKESVVGAIAQIATEDILSSGQTNVTQAIAGKLSGVLTMQTSGAPGANNAQILVRLRIAQQEYPVLCIVSAV